MIRITVEIVPRGREEDKYIHSIAEIANVSAKTIETGGRFGDYAARFFQSVMFDPKKIWKRAKVLNMHRRNRGVWDILGVALLNGCDMIGRNWENIDEGVKEKMRHKLEAEKR